MNSRASKPSAEDASVVVRCDVCLLPLDGNTTTSGVRRHRNQCADEYMRDPARYNARAAAIGIDKDHDAAFAARRNREHS